MTVAFPHAARGDFFFGGVSCPDETIAFLIINSPTFPYFCQLSSLPVCQPSSPWANRESVHSDFLFACPPSPLVQGQVGSTALFFKTSQGMNRRTASRTLTGTRTPDGGKFDDAETVEGKKQTGPGKVASSSFM